MTHTTSTRHQQDHMILKEDGTLSHVNPQIAGNVRPNVKVTTAK